MDLGIWLAALPFGDDADCTVRRFETVGAGFLVIFGGGPIRHLVAGLQFEICRAENVLAVKRFCEGLVGLRAVEEFRQAKTLTTALGMESHVPQGKVGIEGVHANRQLAIFRHGNVFLMRFETRRNEVKHRFQVTVNVDAIPDGAADALPLGVGEEYLIAIQRGFPAVGVIPVVTVGRKREVPGGLGTGRRHGERLQTLAIQIDPTILDLHVGRGMDRDLGPFEGLDIALVRDRAIALFGVRWELIVDAARR